MYHTSLNKRRFTQVILGLSQETLIKLKTPFSSEPTSEFTGISAVQVILWISAMLLLKLWNSMAQATPGRRICFTNIDASGFGQHEMHLHL